MKIIETGFDDLYILEPKVVLDNRGYFMESYHYQDLLQQGIDIRFIQDNQSKSKKGVLRGLHFQNAPFDKKFLFRWLIALRQLICPAESQQLIFPDLFSS